MTTSEKEPSPKCDKHTEEHEAEFFLLLFDLESGEFLTRFVCREGLASWATGEDFLISATNITTERMFSSSREKALLEVARKQP